MLGFERQKAERGGPENQSALDYDEVQIQNRQIIQKNIPGETGGRGGSRGITSSAYLNNQTQSQKQNSQIKGFFIPAAPKSAMFFK